MNIPTDMRQFSPPASENLLQASEKDPDAEKDVAVYRKGVTSFRKAWPALAEGVAEKARKLSERGWNGSELRSELEGDVSEGVAAVLDEVGHRRAYLERRRDEAAGELTDYDSADRLPEEREFRDYVRSMDASDRLKVLRDVAENGSSMARRAVLRSWIPPEMAGLQDEAHRERLLERARKAENAEAFATSRSLDKGLDALDRTADAFRRQASNLVSELLSDA